MTVPVAANTRPTGLTVEPVLSESALRPLQTLFDDCADGVLAIHANGCRLYSNPVLDAVVATDARLPLGTAAPPPYVAPNQQRAYWRLLGDTADMLNGGEPVTGALELVSRDGRRIPARVAIAPVWSPDGSRVAVWLVRPQVDERGGDHGRPALHLEPSEELTAREIDVLQLLLSGRRVSLIARDLYLSEHTVRNHLKSIFRKYDVHSQVELIERCT
jgi:DNA-binding CsgD family transcriptional regulator